MSCNGPPKACRVRGTTPEPPYCWQNKDARRLIRKQLDGDPATRTILAVYGALTEIASDESNSVFMTSQPHIGEWAGGYERKAVQRALQELKALGLIDYESPSGKMRGPIIYSLLSVGASSPNVETLADSPNKSQSRSNNRNNSKKKQTEGVVDEEFERFFEAYPLQKQQGKTEAQKAWNETASSRPSTESILEALGTDCATIWRDISARYIPNPATWLRDERWKNHKKQGPDAVGKPVPVPAPKIDEVDYRAWKVKEGYPPIIHTTPYKDDPTFIQEAYLKNLKGWADPSSFTE